jgi:hypothetical protein
MAAEIERTKWIQSRSSLIGVGKKISNFWGRGKPMLATLKVCTYIQFLYFVRTRKFELERINGETVAGIAFVFLSLLFLYAGTVNDIWAIIIPADYLILAIGCAFIILGVITHRRQRPVVLQ